MRYYYKNSDWEQLGFIFDNYFYACKICNTAKNSYDNKAWKNDKITEKWNKYALEPSIGTIKDSRFYQSIERLRCRPPATTNSCGNVTVSINDHRISRIVQLNDFYENNSNEEEKEAINYLKYSFENIKEIKLRKID